MQLRFKMAAILIAINYPLGGRDNSVGKATRHGINSQWRIIPVAARSKAWACGRSFAGIAGSSPTWGIDVCVVCCRVRDIGTVQENQHKETSTVKVQRERKRRNSEKRKIRARARFSSSVQTGPSAHPVSFLE